MVGARTPMTRPKLEASNCMRTTLVWAAEGGTRARPPGNKKQTGQVRGRPIDDLARQQAKEAPCEAQARCERSGSCARETARRKSAHRRVTVPRLPRTTPQSPVHPTGASARRPAAHTGGGCQHRPSEHLHQWSQPSNPTATCVRRVALSLALQKHSQN